MSLSPEGEKVFFNVLGVYTHPTRNTPIVFIGDEKESIVIPIWVGFLEAQAILHAWKKERSSRPLTVDLLVDIVTHGFKATVTESHIYAVAEGTFYARIVITTRAGDCLIHDARSSDAIAMALRAEAHITVAQEVVQAVGGETVHSKALLDFLRLEHEDFEEDVDENV